ncbi:MAG: PAS domain-containing protein [Acidobacteriota bacterium]|nr:PAS domain-containing protein [Acidobacteriota bacterium]MDE3043551.1 PAS domain-containing protein [Acidobacteriota bacterium]MDE3106900.1 PAS domain-containing protein [Acidobacteriota bacterium]MDE3222557.1 PAS domain-containing protein [Acidobacteriota bacterium]
MANSFPGGLAILGPAGEIAHVNEQMVALTGIDLRVAYGKKLSDINAEGWGRLEPILRRVLSGERVADESVYEVPPSLREYAVWGDQLGGVRQRGLRVRLEYFPIRDDERIIGIGVTGVDSTERDGLVTELEDVRTYYGVLHDVVQAAARFSNADDLYQELVETVIKIDGVDMAWVGLHESGEIRKGPSAGIDDGYLNELKVSAKEGDPYAQGPTGQAILTGSATVLSDFQSAPMSSPWHELATRVGFRSSAAFPLRSGGRVVAVLTMYSRTLRGFDDNVIEMMNAVRSLVTLALDHFQVLASNVISRDLLMMRDGALGTISQGITIVDASASDLPLIYVSPSFLQMTGYTHAEVIGRNCRFLQGPDTNPATVKVIRQAIDTSVGVEVEILNYKKSGERFWNHLTLSPVFDDDGNLTRYVGVQSDVTEQRRLEAQLIQSQRLEAIGTLAGGIAHDFNNLLLVMQGYTALLLRELSDQRLHDVAQRIQDAVDRGADFTRHLLAYSRQQVNTPQFEQLNELVRDGLTLLTGMLGTEITLMTDLEEDVGTIYIDGSQFQQILINLIANARDAMASGGTLVVRTQKVTLGEDYTSRVGEIGPGEYALLEVIDTGVGMTKSVLDRVFEPFFTTKELGTGLGLASVIGIVKQNAGHIVAYSEEGLGSTFKVYFPLVESDQSEVVATHLVAADADAEVSGDETILVVEDDDEVRLLVVTALRELGYELLEASSGPAAIELARAYEGVIDVLITDVIMPAMNGRQVSEELLASRPSLKVIYTSGYPSNVLRDREYLDESTVFIEKPYSSLVVARAIRSLLDS